MGVILQTHPWGLILHVGFTLLTTPILVVPGSN